MKKIFLICWYVLFLLPAATLAAELRQVHAAWDYNSSVADLAGFRLYLSGNPEPVCTILEPSARELECQVLLEEGQATFTMTAFDAADHESAHSALVTVNVDYAGPGQVIPQDGWDLLYADSQETTAENGAATNAFDGDKKTFWHTQWHDASPTHPHEIQISLGNVYDITGFRYLPRTTSSVNGRVKEYAFYVSSDGIDWGSPLATGTFPNTSAMQTVPLPTTRCRYIRLVAASEVNGNSWTSVAELEVLGTVASENTAPTISGTPAANVTAGSAYEFTPVAHDPDSGETLVFNITHKPAWAVFNPANGRLSGTPGNGDAGTTSGITISVLDSNGASASLPVFAITVQGVVVPGDIDGNGVVDLSDLYLAEAILAGQTVRQAIHLEADVNGDGTIGQEETVYILQVVAGLRQ